jgi:hypothetical protein
MARRNQAAQRTRLRAIAGGGPAPQFFTPRSVERLAELSADSKPEARAYTIEGISASLRCPIAKVLRLVRTGKLPKPDRILDGNPRWNAGMIEPLLQRCGYSRAAIGRDQESAKLRAARSVSAGQEWQE